MLNVGDGPLQGGRGGRNGIDLFEAVDEIGNSKGSPGFYAYALADMYFDNLKVTPNN